MPVTAQAQVVFQAIDAFKDTPNPTTFGALRAKLTALIGNRCFDDLRNVAVESGGMADSIGEGHTNDQDFLPWLDTLFSGSKIRATVLLAYAVYVSAGSPNTALAALYHLYLTDMDKEPPVLLRAYADAMALWHTLPDLKKFATGIKADWFTPDDPKRARGRKIYAAFPIVPDPGAQYTPNGHWTENCPRPPPPPPPPPKPDPGSKPSPGREPGEPGSEPSPGSGPRLEPGSEPSPGSGPRLEPRSEPEPGADQTWMLILLIIIVVVGVTANRSRCSGQ